MENKIGPPAKKRKDEEEKSVSLTDRPPARLRGRPPARSHACSSWKVEIQPKNRPPGSNDSELNQSCWKVEEQKKIIPSASSDYDPNRPNFLKIRENNRKRRPSNLLSSEVQPPTTKKAKEATNSTVPFIQASVRRRICTKIVRKC